MDEELEFLRSLEFADSGDQDRMDAIVAELTGLAPIVMQRATVDKLSSGVRDLVVALAASGCYTTDSGDGSNYRAGMECGLPYRMVAVMVLPNQRSEDVLKTVESVVMQRCEDMIVDMVTPDDTMPDMILVLDKDHEAICATAGYVTPPLEALTSGRDAICTLVAWDEWAEEHAPHAEDCGCPWCEQCAVQ